MSNLNASTSAGTPRSPRTRGVSSMHFKSATTGVATKTMRNDLNRLVQAVSDPNTKRIFDMEMQSFFYLFTRYLIERAKSQDLDWDRIKSPAAEQIVPYDQLPKVTSSDALNKLAVLKVNGGLGTSMGMSRFVFQFRLLQYQIARNDRSQVGPRG